MVDPPTISTVLSSLKAAKDIAEGIVKFGKGKALEDKFLEFQSKIINANDALWRIQEERTALLERIRELEEQVAQFKAWEAEKQKYELREVIPGAFAFAPNEEAVQGGEPPHWLCATCYERGKKRFLQLSPKPAATDIRRTQNLYSCVECGAAILAYASP